MSESIHAKGKLFELIHIQQPDGRVFEVARRAPGVRLIIPNSEGRVLLTREYRSELDSWDYRLPGGKVFDTLDEYQAFRESGKDIIVAARAKAIDEAKEEAGQEVNDLTFFKKSTLGATVEWDLYVFEAGNSNAHADGQHLEVGEQVETDNWFSYEQIEKMVLEAKMQEERIALVLLQWIKKARSA